MATQLSLLELLDRPTVEGLIKPDILYRSNDGNFVTRQPENTCFDRKSVRVKPDKLAESLSAFGNGPAVEGGVVAIGIENDGTVTGCKGSSIEKLQSLEFMGRDHCPSGKFSTRRLAVTCH
jgi:ATP-dependent DNA helicase RecG